MKPSFLVLALAIALIATGSFYFLKPEPSPVTLEDHLIKEIRDFRKSGDPSREVDLQSFTARKIRKVCDQPFIVAHDEFEKQIGEKVRFFEPEIRKGNNLLWVFYEDSDYDLIVIPVSSDYFIGGSLTRPEGKVCTSSSKMLLLHVVDGEYETYDFKLDWRTE